MVEYILFWFLYYKAKSVLQHTWMLVLQSQCEGIFNVLIVVHFSQVDRKCHKQKLH